MLIMPVSFNRVNPMLLGTCKFTSSCLIQLPRGGKHCHSWTSIIIIRKKWCVWSGFRNGSGIWAGHQLVVWRILEFGIGLPFRVGGGGRKVQVVWDINLQTPSAGSTSQLLLLPKAALHQLNANYYFYCYYWWGEGGCLDQPILPICRLPPPPPLRILLMPMPCTLQPAVSLHYHPRLCRLMRVTAFSPSSSQLPRSLESPPPPHQLLALFPLLLLLLLIQTPVWSHPLIGFPALSPSASIPIHLYLQRTFR